jgi:hypothetical protein
MDATLIATTVTAAVTILVALTGYLITYWNNIRLSQRAEQLNRINKQLGELYGPMYSIVSTGDRAWQAFRMKYRRGNPYFGDNPPPTDEDLKTWRLWMTTVFMPRNLQLQELITSKADLLIETDMPDCLKDHCAHVASYQAVLQRWKNNDFSENAPIINYPGDALLEYSRRSFRILKEKQTKLIGEMTTKFIGETTTRKLKL